MKINKITQAIGTLALLSMTLPVMADDQTGWFIGGGVGRTLAHIEQEEITADLLDAGFETNQFSIDDRHFGHRLFAGYQFNQNIAIEGGYFDLGKFDYEATTVPAGRKTGALSFKGWNFDVIGLLPVTQRSSLFARFGIHRGEAEASFTGTGAVNVITPEYRKTGLNYKVGLGYQYHMNDAVSLRLEAERYRIDDAVGNDSDIDMLSVNLLYRFGSSQQTRAAAPAPAPAPARAPASPPAATQQYCSALGIEFEIGNESIERVNREHVLVLATFLNKYPSTRATIEGHTDSVGNEADNQRLSQQRAQSLVKYLVREHGIAANRLTAVGHGETRPVADNSTVRGQQANRRINAVIDCASDIAGLDTLPARTTLAMTLGFDAGDAAVNPKYHNQLKDVAEYLRANPGLVVTLEGHTDNASPATAQETSQKRAQNVANYLVQHFNVDRSRLNAEGFGATRRNTYNLTASNRQDNRRVNIVIGYPQ